ncbi:hypothetical protein TNCV_4383611 [Trichonephila clavipes]|nr:hypothetical protein TNCV_4383611 [Trichonephila clavipes]
MAPSLQTTTPRQREDFDPRQMHVHQPLYTASSIAHRLRVRARNQKATWPLIDETRLIRQIMSRRKQRSAFDQVSEFDRGKVVAYRDCGLSFREIGSRVGRNQTTVMRM